MIKKKLNWVALWPFKLINFGQISWTLENEFYIITVKILKFGTPQTIAIIVLKLVKFDVTLHKCIQKKLMEWQTA